MYTPNGECCELSIPNISPKLSTRETDEDAEAPEEDRAYYRHFCQIIFVKTRSLRKIMFVPLPVPFVFQRTAPDLNAWRLKSPLALRSNSGKTFFLFFPLHLLRVAQPCRPAPPCSVPMHLQRGELSAHTPTHAHTLLRLPFQGLNTVPYTCGAVVKSKKLFPESTAVSRLIEN